VRGFLDPVLDAPPVPETEWDPDSWEWCERSSNGRDGESVS